MTDQLEIYEEEVIEEYTLDDLEHYWTETGLPVFVANKDDICDIVEGLGFSIYYLLGNVSKITTSTSTNPTTKQTTTTTNQSKGMALLKVVNNIVGRTVSVSNDTFDSSFLAIEEQAIYHMPAIPHVLIDKLDQFFRLVDAQHGTESIVMLTYDLTKEGSAGWGILVPDQTNTSVHCNYDPHSIAEIKPDNVMIVGSVHSHPGMSAYASGTDHKDQADFDGLHITFGWQKSVNNGATQYHIEMQMSGKAYTLQPEDVFEDHFVTKDPDPEVVEWTGKVKKVSPPYMGGHYTGHTHQSQQTAGATTPGPQNRSVKTDNQLNAFFNLKNFVEKNTSFQFEKNAIIAAEIGSNTTKCPCCDAVLDSYIFTAGYCDFCYVPIIEKDSSLIEIYQKLSLYCQDLYIDFNSPVYLWTVDEDGTNSFMQIFETLSTYGTSNTLSAYSQKDLVVEENETNWEALSEDVFYCCMTNISDNMCDCKTKITAHDVLGFDHEVGAVHLYTSKTKCQTCEFYYDISCPLYKELLEQWVNDPSINANAFAGAIDGTDCAEYELYGSSDNYDYVYERD